MSEKKFIRILIRNQQNLWDFFRIRNTEFIFQLELYCLIPEPVGALFEVLSNKFIHPCIWGPHQKFQLLKLRRSFLIINFSRYISIPLNFVTHVFVKGY
jgi:hypothetical protein